MTQKYLFALKSDRLRPCFVISEFYDVYTLQTFYIGIGKQRKKKASTHILSPGDVVKRRI